MLQGGRHRSPRELMRRRHSCPLVHLRLPRFEHARFAQLRSPLGIRLGLTGGMGVGAEEGMERGDTEERLRTERYIYVFSGRSFPLLLGAEIRSRRQSLRGREVQIQLGLKDNGDNCNQIFATCSSNQVQSSLPSSGSLLRGSLTLAHGTRYYSAHHELRWW